MNSSISTLFAMAALGAAAAGAANATDTEAHYDFCVHEKVGVMTQTVHAQWVFAQTDLGKDTARLLITAHYRPDAANGAVQPFDAKICGNIPLIEKLSSWLSLDQLRNVLRQIQGNNANDRINALQLLDATTRIEATPASQAADKPMHSR